MTHKALSFPTPLVHHPSVGTGDTHHLVYLTSTSYGSLLLTGSQTPPTNICLLVSHSPSQIWAHASRSLVKKYFTRILTGNKIDGVLEGSQSNAYGDKKNERPELDGRNITINKVQSCGVSSGDVAAEMIVETVVEVAVDTAVEAVVVMGIRVYKRTAVQEKKVDKAEEFDGGGGNKTVV
ncbi:hypothetical protein Bca4012_019180 [Brassica carinata]